MSRSTEKKKSKSKQLRDVFYILWEQDDEGHKLFEPYYEEKMSKLLNHYKKLIK